MDGGILTNVNFAGHFADAAGDVFGGLVNLLGNTGTIAADGWNFAVENGIEDYVGGGAAFLLAVVTMKFGSSMFNPLIDRIPGLDSNSLVGSLVGGTGGLALAGIVGLTAVGLFRNMAENQRLAENGTAPQEITTRIAQPAHQPSGMDL